MWVQNVIGAGIISSKYHIYFFFLLACCVLFSTFLLSALNPVSLRWRCWLPSAAWRLLCSFQPLASSLAVWSALLKYSCMMCLQPKWVKIYGCVFIFKSYPLSSGVIKKNTGAGEVNHEKLLLKLHQFHIYVLVSLCIPAILWHIAADSDGAAAGAGNSYFSHCGALCHLQKSASHGSSRVWWQHSDPDALLWGMPGKHTHMCKSCSCLYHYLQQQTFTDEYSIKVYHM